MTQENKKPKKNLFSVSNIITLILALFVIALLVSPSFKASVTGMLMKVGLFQPKIEETEPQQVVQTQGTNELTFQDESGNEIHLSELKGKVVFMNFWATWCPPCRAEMPSINTLYNKYKNNDNIVFLMVDIDNKMDKSVKYIQDNKLDLPIHVSNTPIPEAYLGQAVPTTVVLNKNGEIAFRHEGMADYSSAEFQKFIEEQLGK